MKILQMLTIIPGGMEWVLIALVVLLLFGGTNYLMMLRRYEKDIRKRKFLQQKKISKLYPKGSFIF